MLDDFIKDMDLIDVVTTDMTASSESLEAPPLY